MRSTGNFNPEWGYLAPAPSFMRTARVVLVATAVGATAGAAVVLSLIDHPAVEGERTALSAHAIVTSVQAATPATVPLAAVAPAAAPVSVAVAPVTLPAKLPPTAAAAVAPVNAPLLQAQPPAVAPPLAPADSAAVSQPDAGKPVPGVASLSDTPPQSEAAPALTPDDTTLAPVPDAAQQKKKHHTSGWAKSGPNIGTVLRRIFAAHAGVSYYPNH